LQSIAAESSTLSITRGRVVQIEHYALLPPSKYHGHDPSLILHAKYDIMLLLSLNSYINTPGAKRGPWDVIINTRPRRLERPAS
jgi:hypothetical protein